MLWVIECISFVGGKYLMASRCGYRKAEADNFMKLQKAEEVEPPHARDMILVFVIHTNLRATYPCGGLL